MKLAITHAGESFALSDETGVVLAATYAHLDEGQGGITEAEVHPEDLLPLSALHSHDEIFFRSPDESDTLDDSTEETARATRIWWRAIVLE